MKLPTRSVTRRCETGAPVRLDTTKRATGVAWPSIAASHCEISRHRPSCLNINIFHRRRHSRSFSSRQLHVTGLCSLYDRLWPTLTLTEPTAVRAANKTRVYQKSVNQINSMRNCVSSTVTSALIVKFKKKKILVRSGYDFLKSQVLSC